jgi:hypothetical protein
MASFFSSPRKGDPVEFPGGDAAVLPYATTCGPAGRAIGGTPGCRRGVVYASSFVDPMRWPEGAGPPRGFDEDATAWLKEIEFDRKLRA